MPRTITPGLSGIRSHHRWLLAVFCSPLSTLPALAGGQFNPGNSVIVLPAEITESGNASVGTTLWTSSRVTSSLTLTDLLLDTTSFIFADIQDGTRGNGDIYETNISGLGVRWWGNWNGNRFPSGGVTLPITTNQENRPPRPDLRVVNSFAQSVWIELVKTGNIVNGNLSVASSAWVRYSCGTPCTPWRVTVAGQTNVIATPFCSVATANQTVSLGRVAITRFTGVGSVSDPTPFAITLNCTGGVPGSATRPHVTLTDAFESANRSTTLSVRNMASSATGIGIGIGIQILHNGSVLGYGPPSAAPGTINQWEAGTVREGEARFTIALAARYVQTQPVVRAGAATGWAVFTMNYQ